MRNLVRSAQRVMIGLLAVVAAGCLTDPITGRVEGVPGGDHEGYDIFDRNQAGTALAGGTVYSSCNGTVEYRFGTRMGHAVIITHADGFVTRYHHLRDVYVSTGQSVGNGHPIGSIGDSGNAAGNPHLHFEIRWNNVPLGANRELNYGRMLFAKTALDFKPGPPCTAAPTCNQNAITLSAGEGLGRGQAMFSCDGMVMFVHQSDGNVVLYRKRQNPGQPFSWQPRWASGTDGRETSMLLMDWNGDLILYRTLGGGLVWHSNTAGHSGARFVVQEDCNGVIYTPGNVPVWATGTICGQPL